MARSFILLLGLITWFIEFNNGAETLEILEKSSIYDKKFKNDNINENEIELNQGNITGISDTNHSIIPGSEKLPNTS